MIFEDQLQTEPDVPTCANAGVGAMPVLARLASLVDGVVARVASDCDLTPVQARMLCILERGPWRMAELAHALGAEKAALTGLVDRAERRGLVRRAAVPGDRRALHVVLTEDGARSAAAFRAAADGALERLLEPLTDAEHAAFDRAMAVVVESQRVPGRGGPASSPA
ncbi:MarR family winged helix-turn-helix transcriptional regulator [Antribacter gilvus]|uniref:MarR family winged helix-turn-helix transcriptional regulator n=1 Tax=Antribacter gilvus TaxID=2304675 RepID=UPI00197F00C7|nr:MarR family transcriptional regulator [Antribacter gilvus]